jgi:hypothetical protein
VIAAIHTRRTIDVLGIQSTRLWQKDQDRNIFDKKPYANLLALLMLTDIAMNIAVSTQLPPPSLSTFTTSVRKT